MPTNTLPPAPRRILILDANQRSALAAVRSLGKLADVYIYAADCSALALAGSSRYCREYHRHPSPHGDYAAFSSWLIEFVGKHSIDFLLPMTEISSRSALALREHLGACIVPFADLQTVLALSDKWRLIELAREVDVPHPESQLIVNAAQLPPLGEERFPLVIKPCLSRIFHAGQWLDTCVHIARTPGELADFMREKPYLREHAFILQEFIPGHGAGIFALYANGVASAFFAHRRLREKPPSGGVSVLSESVPLDPQLLRLSKALLDRVRWHGVAMIEFRIGSDGTPYLMEINTRFWGSLQLAIDAGVDFPRLLFNASIDSSAVDSAPLAYRYGRRLRWLLGDVDNLYLTLRSKQYSILQKLSGIMNFLTPRPFITRHEINRLDDLKPAWFELKLYLQNYFSKR